MAKILLLEEKVVDAANEEGNENFSEKYLFWWL